MIDLRSDTVTLPSKPMRQAMVDAPLGDDVIDSDPTVARLQNEVADMLGKEAAIFMPSGTMTNQIAVRIHCRPGDEMICEQGCHIYNYEQGAFAQLSGVVARTIAGPDYLMNLDQIRDLIRPQNDHVVRTRLLCLENTHNQGGGRILPYDEVVALCQWAREHQLRTHLDGARLFNASVASGIPVDRWAEHFDTVSVCFSKGLGAPVGSALLGPAPWIEQARRHRKLFGGGMRQSGILAAGALYALHHQVDRLAEDHHTAAILADVVRRTDGIQLEPEQVDTNIVIFRLDSHLGAAERFVHQLKQMGVWMMPFSPVHVRAVTHLHITEDDAHQAGQILQQLVSQPANNV